MSQAVNFIIEGTGGRKEMIELKQRQNYLEFCNIVKFTFSPNMSSSQNPEEMRILDITNVSTKVVNNIGCKQEFSFLLATFVETFGRNSKNDDVSRILQKFKELFKSRKAICGITGLTGN